MIRTLTDDTLLVFLSDCHIGGDARDIFETPGELASLFESLDAYAGPVELVLAGDFFDFLRIAEVPEGENRASATISRPEYRELFVALRRLASAPDRTVVYLPGNHDAEAWWNQEVRAELERGGLVDEFALSYGASFESDADQVVYCEHGNEFDVSNTIRDYDDPLDTPLGTHVVTDVLPRLPTGWRVEGGDLRDVDRIFPLTVVTEWLAGRLFYHVATLAARWLLLPLAILYTVHALFRGGGSAEVLVEVGYDLGALLLVFVLFLVVAGRTVNRFIRSSSSSVQRPDERELIQERLEAGEPAPLGGDVAGEVRVFVSGHTHAPSLTRFENPAGRPGIQVNSGCWLRQLQPVPARLGLPPVFVSRFVQTHVRVYRDGETTHVELWEYPRPARQRLRLTERVAVAGRIPDEPDPDVAPGVREWASLERD